MPSGWRRGALVFRTVPAKPPAGHGGGPRRRTQERRVSPCVHKQLDARTSVSDSHIRGSLKEGRAPGPTAGRSAGPQRARNTETCVGALKEDTNFIEECVPCLSPDPPPSHTSAHPFHGRLLGERGAEGKDGERRYGSARARKMKTETERFALHPSLQILLLN